MSIGSIFKVMGSVVDVLKIKRKPCSVNREHRERLRVDHRRAHDADQSMRLLTRGSRIVIHTWDCLSPLWDREPSAPVGGAVLLDFPPKVTQHCSRARHQIL